MKKLLLFLYLGLIVGMPAAVSAGSTPLPSGHGESEKPQPSEPDNPPQPPKPK